MEQYNTKERKITSGITSGEALKMVTEKIEILL